MKQFLLLFLLIIFGHLSITAQAVDDMGCTGALGDVKHSILEESDFQTVNGDCWVLLDGRSIKGSSLDILTSRQSIPDGRGYFIRCYDNRKVDRVDVDRDFGELVGTVQDDEFKEHDHWLPGMLKGSIELKGISTYHWVIEHVTNGSFRHTNNSGGFETRPKNISIYTYIRIQ